MSSIKKESQAAFDVDLSEPNDRTSTITSSSKIKGAGGWRYTIAILGFFAMTNSYAMRSLLSVTIVAMVGVTQKNSTNLTDQCGKSTEFIKTQPGEFQWSQELQGIINGAFYYGYIVPQIIGGRLAERYSGKWVIFIGGCLGTLATFLGPVAARTNVVFFIITRVLCGFGLAVFQPSLHSLIARWAPPHERSIFSAIIYSGNQFGVVIAMPIAGYVDQYAPDGGWPWSFYVLGIIGVVWLVLWLAFIYQTPAEHPWISSEERKFIEMRLANAMNTKHTYPVPWKKVFASKSVWALILCHFGYNWGFYTLLQQLPTYMSNILGFSISSNGVLSSLPYFIMMVVGYISSYAAFQVTKRKMLPVVVVRKGLNTLAFYGSAVAILVVTFLTCQTLTIYGMLMLAVVFCGLTYAGFQINHVDLSPNFAGTLEGITNSAASIPGIISPYIVGVITEGNETQERWHLVFYISVTIMLLCGTFYLLAGSTNLKSWNEPDEISDIKPFDNVHGIVITTSSNE